MTIKGITLQKIKHALFLCVFTEREKLQLKVKKQIKIFFSPWCTKENTLWKKKIWNQSGNQSGNQKAILLLLFRYLTEFNTTRTSDLILLTN